MEYMGEFNILQWTGEYFIQIPSGFKETGLTKNNLMEIVKDTLTSKEIEQLKDMESLSTSFPLKKKTAKEVMKEIAEDAANQGMNFLVDTLIESVTGLDMGTDKKGSLFGELFTMVMDEEERSYIASVGIYEKSELFFESILPTSEVIRPYFKTEYEADYFVAHVVLNTFEKTKEFELDILEEDFESQIMKLEQTKEEFIEFSFQNKMYQIKRLESKKLSYNPFKMSIEI